MMAALPGSVVDARWAQALAPLQQLSQLTLDSCKGWDATAVAMMCGLTSLTGVQVLRWGCKGRGVCAKRWVPTASTPPLASGECHACLAGAVTA